MNAIATAVRFPEVFLLTCCCVLAGAGCKVSKPSSMETGMANEVKHKITVGGKDTPNPVPATAESIADGQEHFGHHCGICHGLDGEATGVPFAANMSPPIPSLSSKDVQEYTDGQLKWILDNGINPSGMPAWKGQLTDEEMWKLVNYMRHLPLKGSLGVPEVYEKAHAKHQHLHQEGH
jgi:mono/diheme cytochrome c family protein